ncbi:DUF6985 domain-containing protein [Clostridium lundense]|uniref:DUF6985 domain-containing protein n=1 Tax=Clostridium lundense TaxID=319475 RepID=UPI0004877541|nr:hypothetical protein [Clostridium lundense]
MNYSIDGLEYYEELGEWGGYITVKCSQSLFNKDEISLGVYMKGTERLTEAEYNAINHIKINFPVIYEKILKGLYEWYKREYIPSEIFDEDTSDFIPVKFNCYEDIHRYIGTPNIEILHEYTKEDNAYFSIYFYDNCLLSIEHGLTALFHKNNMIDIDAADTEAVVNFLEYYEEDCTLWEKDFWLIKWELGKDESFDDVDLIREKWLK